MVWVYSWKWKCEGGKAGGGDWTEKGKEVPKYSTIRSEGTYTSMKILVGVCGSRIARVNRRKSWLSLAKLGTLEGLSLTAKGQLWPEASRYLAKVVCTIQYIFLTLHITAQ